MKSSWQEGWGKLGFQTIDDHSLFHKNKDVNNMTFTSRSMSCCCFIPELQSKKNSKKFKKNYKKTTLLNTVNHMCKASFDLTFSSPKLTRRRLSTCGWWQESFATSLIWKTGALEDDTERQLYCHLKEDLWNQWDEINAASPSLSRHFT